MAVSRSEPGAAPSQHGQIGVLHYRRPQRGVLGVECNADCRLALRDPSSWPNPGVSVFEITKGSIIGGLRGDETENF
jgi:hypothetical protein